MNLIKDKDINGEVTAPELEDKKKFKPITQTYKMVCFAMGVGMMFPNPHNEKKRFLLLLAMYIYFVPVYVMWFYDVTLCLVNFNLENLTRQMSMGIPSLFCHTKLILVNIKRKELKAIIDEINSDYESYNHLEEEYQNIARENRKSIQKLEKIWAVTITSTVVIFPIMAGFSTINSTLFNEEPRRFMVHDMDIPWVREARYDTPYFEIVFAYCMTLCFPYIIGYVGYDGMFSICTFHTCLKMKMFSHTLSKAFDKSKDVSSVKRDIVKVVKAQCKTFKFIEVIQKEYEIWLTMIFVVTVAQICMVLYQVVATKGALDVRYLIFTFAATLHCYVPCYLASNVSSTGAEVANIAYCSGWERVPDSGVRRMLSIIIARAQIPVEITALGVLRVNMELFVSILHTSYSMFTLMRTTETTNAN